MALEDVKDPEQLSIKNTNIYLGREVVDISSDDHEFDIKCRGVAITGDSGDIVLTLKDGNDITLPIVVPTGGTFFLDGFYITHVVKTGTTVGAVPYGWK